MGNQNQKGSSNASINVSPKELNAIEKILQKSEKIEENDLHSSIEDEAVVCCSSDEFSARLYVKPSRSIDGNSKRKSWRTHLTDPLMNSYVQFIFHINHKNSSSVSLKTVAVLLSELERGSRDQQAALLHTILKSKDTATLTDMKQEGGKQDLNNKLYLSELVLSCFKILERKPNGPYQKWKNLSSKSSNVDVSFFVDYLCQDLKCEGDTITEENIFHWLAQCQLVHLLHSFVILHLYGLYQSKESSGQMMSPLLPKLKAAPSNDSVSSVLSPPDVLFLNQLLPAEFQREWRLLFSSNSHGESYSILLKNIIDQGPTIIVVQDNDGHIFGGFAADSWRLGPKFYGDSSCFLFTLNPKCVLCRATGYNEHFMYINYNQNTLPNGLGMGGQFDYWGLWIDSEFGVGACSNTCTTFDNYSSPSKNKNFQIANLEVWGVGIPPPTAAERGERTLGSGRSIMDSDPAATYILEVAGKTRHSDGLRDKPDDEG